MMNNDNIQVSVIIPIYKTEKYIEKCARSLFEQTLKNIEYIFVDDCGNDRSIEILNKILNEYPERSETARIIHHEKNKGLPAARATGIKFSNGEYIIHCDSDDWVDTEMYEELYRLAKKENADIVWCDFIDEYPNKSNYRREEAPNNSESLIKEILKGKVHGTVCNKLIRKEIYTKNNICPLEGINIWEDLYLSVSLLLHANRIAYLNRGFYHYNLQNPNSLLSSLTMRKIEERITICNKIKTILISNNKYAKFEPELKERFLIAKIELIVSNNIRNLNLWRELWPECNNQIFRTSFSYDNKIIQYLVKLKFDVAAITLVNIKNGIKRMLLH